MKIFFSIIGIFLIVGGFWFYTKWDSYAPTTYIIESPAGTTTINTETNTTSTTTPTFTMIDISNHRDNESCFSAINGVVYDLTFWINLHPGGKSAILSLCGIDGTEKFMNQHKGEKKFMDVLARFKIGVLTKNGNQASEPIACTMDAKMCPDGTYVGRTGPKCEFVCP